MATHTSCSLSRESKRKGFTEKWQICKIKKPNPQDFLYATLNSQRGGSGTHKQINMPMWRTKSLSISLDFQKQVSHPHKRLPVPAASKTQTHNAQKELRAGPREGQSNVFRKTQILGDSPGITSQMGTSRVCSKLAKLHSNFPSNTPSQSPIGLSWKSWRHEKHITLPGVLHLCKTDQAGATRASSPSIFLLRSIVLLLYLKMVLKLDPLYCVSSVSKLLISSSPLKQQIFHLKSFHLRALLSLQAQPHYSSLVWNPGFCSSGII